MFQRVGLQAPTHQVESLSLMSTRELLRDGRYLTLQPRSIMCNDVLVKQFTSLKHPALVLPRKVACIRRRNYDHSPMAGEFLDALRLQAKASVEDS